MPAWAAILALANSLIHASTPDPTVKIAERCSGWVASWKTPNALALLGARDAEACWSRIPAPQMQNVLEPLSEETRLTLSEAALDRGHLGIARVTAPAAQDLPALRHRREILSARLAATQGHWQETDARLQAWKSNPNRREGSGDILFWQGWSSLQQGRRKQADSLFILASAYVEEQCSQRALEYRFAMLLDSGKALQDFIRGLPESPWPDSARLLALRRIPVASPLYPQGLWEQALLLEKNGNRSDAIAVLEDLSKDASVLPGRRAAALLAYFQEQHPDSAIAAYERLLLEYQQGVPAEFARSRMKTLKGSQAP